MHLFLKIAVRKILKSKNIGAILNDTFDILLLFFDVFLTLLTNILGLYLRLINSTQHTSTVLFKKL